MNRKITALIALLLVLGIALGSAQKGKVAVPENEPPEFQLYRVDFVAITPTGTIKAPQLFRLNLQAGGENERAAGVDTGGNPC